jgi:hypothetical protein
MNTCTICNLKFEAESPAVLFVSRYGTKRVLCEECERLLDLATESEDSAEKTEAREALTALATHMKDNDAVDMLRDVLNGEYSAEVTEEDLAAEKEWLEENANEEEEEEKQTWFDYALPIATGAIFVAFMIWFIFFR